ncbi:MAG TPA: flagellar motor protein MotB [Candidatus Kapabacteria bacterium]|nr:flagellar motor protein MotB [Candidatus Kapabacteria bacterium]
MKSNKKNNAQPTPHSPDKDRYLVTYADLITLLLGLFVILYASSQVDQEKFKDISSALTKYFKSQPANPIEGGDGVLEASRRAIPEPMIAPREAKSIKEIESEAANVFKDYIAKGELSLRTTSEGLVVVLPEKLLFRSGRAEIQSDGLPVIDSLAKILATLNNTIFVDGHTDNTPIRTFQYESNWHLSVARALNVGYRLISLGVSGDNLVIRGFADKRPVEDNSTEEGRAKNRRVEITISRVDDNSPAKLTQSD